MARSRGRVILNTAGVGQVSKNQEELEVRVKRLERMLMPEFIPYDEEKDRGWRQRGGDEGAAKALRRQTVEMLQLEGLLREARKLLLTARSPDSGAGQLKWEARTAKFLNATGWVEEK